MKYATATLLVVLGWTNFLISDEYKIVCLNKFYEFVSTHFFILYYTI